MTLAMISPGRPRLREGSRFEAVVRSQTPRLWPIACILTGERESAAQVVKQCFAELAPRLEGMRSVDAADWLRRRVILACRGRARERAGASEREIEALLPRFDARGRHERRPGGTGRPAAAALRRSYREGLERLPPAWREVVLLCDVLKLEPRKAAELLNLREALLRDRLHQARLALVEQVEGGCAR